MYIFTCVFTLTVKYIYNYTFINTFIIIYMYTCTWFTLNTCTCFSHYIYISLNYFITGDTAANLGAAMDELMRHQPLLRASVMSALIKVSLTTLTFDLITGTISSIYPSLSFLFYSLLSLAS